METVRLVGVQLGDISEETIMRGGIGPKSYEIRELPEISLEFKLDEMGELELLNFDVETGEIVDEMYPIIDAATTAADWRGSIFDGEHRSRFRQHLALA